MSQNPKSVIWNAEPHTIAKIRILESYLNAWFAILGTSRRKVSLVYIDGFAGPGEYSNYPEGSPTTALRVGRDTLERIAPRWKAESIHYVFIESDPRRSDHLGELCAQFRLASQVKVYHYNTTFEEGIARFQAENPDLLGVGNPAFIFVDPFGATGVPFGTIRYLLGSPTTELLMNFDADGVGRIYDAGESANHGEILDKVFGCDLWKALPREGVSANSFYRSLLRLYTQQLRSLERVRYVFPFEMRQTRDAMDYFLVFAGQHPLGLEKMKEAMKRFDQTGEYRFSDADSGQDSLFRYDIPEKYAMRVAEVFAGRTVTFGILRDYALNDTPFNNPKQMLKCLESKDLIVVETYGSRHKGTFNEEKIKSITFK